MKKMFMVMVILLIFSIPALAEAETILSLNMGMKTGFMGFTLERLNNLTSFEVGFGITDDTIRLSTGSRFYFPERSPVGKTRSNVYMNPNIGIVWNWLESWDYENPSEPVNAGYATEIWAGLNMGYDMRWGEYRQYRLTFEGGFGLRNDTRLRGVPMINIGLGYIF